VVLVMNVVRTIVVQFDGLLFCSSSVVVEKAPGYMRVEVLFASSCPVLDTRRCASPPTQILSEILVRSHPHLATSISFLFQQYAMRVRCFCTLSS
jgi:hypothetical protein